MSREIKRQRCESCDGRGKVPGWGHRRAIELTCSACGGAGYLEVLEHFHPSTPLAELVDQELVDKLFPHRRRPTR